MSVETTPPRLSEVVIICTSDKPSTAREATASLFLFVTLGTCPGLCGCDKVAVGVGRCLNPIHPLGAWESVTELLEWTERGLNG